MPRSQGLLGDPGYQKIKPRRAGGETFLSYQGVFSLKGEFSALLTEKLPGAKTLPRDTGKGSPIPVTSPRGSPGTRAGSRIGLSYAARTGTALSAKLTEPKLHIRIFAGYQVRQGQEVKILYSVAAFRPGEDADAGITATVLVLGQRGELGVAERPADRDAVARRRTGHCVELADIDWTARRWNATQAYSESKLCVTALARLWPDVLSNAVDPGWVPTKMGGAAATDDLHMGYLTQTWLAVSNDAAATVSGGYWYHRQRQELAPHARDPVFQDQLMDRLTALTGLALV